MNIPNCFIHNGIIYPPNTNSDILNRVKYFECRDNDVFVASFPKSGTTWVVEIVDEILRRGCEPNNNLPTYLRARMIEFGPPAISTAVIDDENFDNDHKFEGGRRLFKTHLPFNNLPENLKTGKSNARIIYVVRNIKDNLVSFYHFCRMNQLYGLFEGSFDDFYELWLNSQTPHGDWFYHVKEFIESSKTNSNILIVSYEQLLSNTCEIVKRISEFIKEDLNDEIIGKIVENTSIENMRKNNRTNRKEVKAYRQEISQFFRKGIVGDWKNYFNDQQIEQINQLTKEKLSEDLINVLETLFLSYQ